MHYASLVHFVEGQYPLPITNTPYLPESEYLTREARIFKLLRQTILPIAQYEILFYCKTRSDKGKLQRLLRCKILALTLS